VETVADLLRREAGSNGLGSAEGDPLIIGVDSRP